MAGDSTSGVRISVSCHKEFNVEFRQESKERNMSLINKRYLYCPKVDFIDLGFRPFMGHRSFGPRTCS